MDPGCSSAPSDDSRAESIFLRASLAWSSPAEATAAVAAGAAAAAHDSSVSLSIAVYCPHIRTVASGCTIGVRALVDAGLQWKDGRRLVT